MSRRARVALAVVGALAAAWLAVAVSVVAVAYPVEELRPDRGAPLVVTDRRGVVLRRLPGEGGRRGPWVRVAELPSVVTAALIASEDARFFEHRGVDPLGLARAAWLDLARGRLTFGGSTVTMQLVRLHRGTVAHRTLFNKARELVWALRLEQALDKNAILEQYLNRAPYGGGVVGFGAAAEAWFGRPAAALSDGQATLLAVLPRAPTAYDPRRGLDAALARRRHVLSLLVGRGLLDERARARIEAEPLALSIAPPPSRAPHFVAQAVASLPPEVRARGGVVVTTLDAALEEALEARLRAHVDALAPSGLGQAGVVVLDTAGGEVLALTGSRGLDGDGGHVDITTRFRHPGSALKPFVYAEALERGATPSSIVADAADVPSAYVVKHQTQPEHGPVRLREALAGSYNLAAVHLLEEVGLERVYSKLEEAQLGPFRDEPGGYGLRLALGAARVRLVDLAAAYGFLVRDGRVIAPRTVVEVIAPTGDRWRPPPAPERALFSPEASWLTMDILADSAARRHAFGPELPLDLPFPVAAKTGTARGFADTVTVAVTRERTVAAWAGNFDGRPTHGLVAMQAAAPLARAGLLLAADGRALTLPPRPARVVTRAVCALSGGTPTAHCPHTKREHALADQPAPPPCPWHAADGLHLPTAFARFSARR